jgi:hypothetical protein
MSQAVHPYGVTGEFGSPEELLTAVRSLRDNGYTKMDAFTPFPVHGLDKALGLGRSQLGYLVFGAGLVGTASALLLQWWTGAVDYPLVIGGKPLFAVEFSVPITFELAVLFAAFAAVGGMLAWNGLPRLHHPVLTAETYRQATNDAFVLVVEGEDPKFDADGCKRLLESLGARRTEVVGEEAA